MVVHDGEDIGTRLVDFAVDVALGHRFASLGVERIALQVVLQDVLHLHALRRKRAREVIALRV